MVTFDCAVCSTKLTVPDSEGGRPTRCTECGEVLVAPRPAPHRPAKKVVASGLETDGPTCPSCASDQLWPKTVPAPGSRPGEPRFLDLLACARCGHTLDTPPADDPTKPGARRRPTDARRDEHPSHAKMQRLRRMRHLRWAAPIVAVGFLFAVGGWWVLAGIGVRPGSSRVEDELAEMRERQAKLAEEQRAEVERHRQETEQQRAELTRLRDEQNQREAAENLKAATQKTSAALVQMRSKGAAMVNLDRELRAIIAKFDQDMMLAFADKDVNPADTTQPGVKEFYEQRKRLLDKASGQLEKMLVELRQIARGATADPQAPADIKSTFETEAGLEINAAEALTKKLYPEPLASYQDAAAAVRTVRDVIRQQKVEKSKEGAVALEKYEKALPSGSDVEPCKIDLIKVVGLLVELNSLHEKRKLDKRAAIKALEQVPVTRGFEWKWVSCMRDFIRVAGNVRPRHDPDVPSYGETFRLFSELVGYETIEKELLSRPRFNR